MIANFWYRWLRWQKYTALDVGIAVNTSEMDAHGRDRHLSKLRTKTGLPCLDPIIDGVQPMVSRLLEIE